MTNVAVLDQRNMLTFSNLKASAGSGDWCVSAREHAPQLKPDLRNPCGGRSVGRKQCCASSFSALRRLRLSEDGYGRFATEQNPAGLLPGVWRDGEMMGDRLGVTCVSLQR